MSLAEPPTGSKPISCVVDACPSNRWYGVMTMPRVWTCPKHRDLEACAVIVISNPENGADLTLIDGVNYLIRAKLTKFHKAMTVSYVGRFIFAKSTPTTLRFMADTGSAQFVEVPESSLTQVIAV